jgi:signal transduction histidine kinase
MSKKREGRPQIDTKQLYNPSFLSDLIHLVNHNVGNPLTAIITLASLIERTSGAAPLPISSEQLAGYGGSITREAWKISSISEHLVLLLSQRSEPSGEIQPSDLVERAISRLEMRGQIKGGLVNIDDLQPTDIVTAVDTEQLQVVVAELLMNAKREIDELVPTGVNKTETINVSGTEDSSGYRLLVSNRIARPFTGELSELFNPLVGLYREEKCLGIGLTAAALTAARFGLGISIEILNRDGAEYFVASLSFPSAKP